MASDAFDDIVIGAGSLLERGIDVVVKSSGVGQNLRDHPAPGILSHTEDTRASPAATPTPPRS